MSFVNVILIYFEIDYSIESTLDLDLSNIQISVPLENQK